MSSIRTNDGTEICYKDWGKGQPVVFSHGWPLSSDAFEDQMFFLASRGYRCIAYDQRGHGRSGQPWRGNSFARYSLFPTESVRKCETIIRKAQGSKRRTRGGLENQHRCRRQNHST